jgi:hypothetical protein
LQGVAFIFCFPFAVLYYQGWHRPMFASRHSPFLSRVHGFSAFPSFAAI